MSDDFDKGDGFFFEEETIPAAKDGALPLFSANPGDAAGEEVAADESVDVVSDASEEDTTDESVDDNDEEEGAGVQELGEEEAEAAVETLKNAPEEEDEEGEEDDNKGKKTFVILDDPYLAGSCAVIVTMVIHPKKGDEESPKVTISAATHDKPGGFMINTRLSDLGALPAQFQTAIAIANDRLPLLEKARRDEEAKALADKQKAETAKAEREAKKKASASNKKEIEKKKAAKAKEVEKKAAEEALKPKPVDMFAAMGLDITGGES